MVTATAAPLGDINKLRLSTSGLSLINSFLKEDKPRMVFGQNKDLLQGQAAAKGNEPANEIAPQPNLTDAVEEDGD